MNVKQQAYKELKEELGVKPAEVRALDVVGVVEHGDGRIVDVCLKAETGLSAPEMLHRYQNAKDRDEHSVLQVLLIATAVRTLAARGESVTPHVDPVLRKLASAVMLDDGERQAA